MNLLKLYVEEYQDEIKKHVDQHKEAAINLLQPKYQPPSSFKSVTRDRKQKELELWQSWDKGGRQPKDLSPLLNSMRPLIQSQVNKYSGLKGVPKEALESEFKNQAVRAIKTFNPNKGSQLNTWINSQIRKGGRFVKTYQNMGRIVENRSDAIAEFKAGKEQLANQLGRPPEDAELLPYLKKMPWEGKKKHKWSNAEVSRMNAELRADILSSQFENDPNRLSVGIDEEVMSFLREDLDDRERQVFDLIKTPGSTGGKTLLMAKQLGWSPAKVSRMKKSIEAKAREYKEALE
jgi:DNA-directed RNA polymerase specialized sigma subunit